MAVSAHVGSAAATGTVTNDHLIDAREVEGFVCEPRGPFVDWCA